MPNLLLSQLNKTVLRSTPLVRPTLPWKQCGGVQTVIMKNIFLHCMNFKVGLANGNMLLSKNANALRVLIVHYAQWVATFASCSVLQERLE